MVAGLDALAAVPALAQQTKPAEQQPSATNSTPSPANLPGAAPLVWRSGGGLQRLGEALREKCGAQQQGNLRKQRAEPHHRT